MIFQETSQWVINQSPWTGKCKTQTRRLVKPGDYGVTDENDTYLKVNSNGRLLYKRGGIYNVQPGVGEKSIAKIQITQILREDIRLISIADAIAEGFKDQSRFIFWWAYKYDPILSVSKNMGDFEGINIWNCKDDNIVLDYIKTRDDKFYQAWVYKFSLVDGDKHER